MEQLLTSGSRSWTTHKARLRTLPHERHGGTPQILLLLGGNIIVHDGIGPHQQGTAITHHRRAAPRLHRRLQAVSVHDGSHQGTGSHVQWRRRRTVDRSLHCAVHHVDVRSGRLHLLLLLLRMTLRTAGRRTAITHGQTLLMPQVECEVPGHHDGNVPPTPPRVKIALEQHQHGIDQVILLRGPCAAS